MRTTAGREMCVAGWSRSEKLWWFLCRMWMVVDAAAARRLVSCRWVGRRACLGRRIWRRWGGAVAKASLGLDLVFQIRIGSVGSDLMLWLEGYDDRGCVGAAGLVGGAIGGKHGGGDGDLQTAAGGGIDLVRPAAFLLQASCMELWAWLHSCFWAGALLLGFERPKFIYVIFSFYGYVFMVLNFLLLAIKRGGRCPGVGTLCAGSGLGRVRVPCIVKWSHPPSGRMKHRVVGYDSVRPHIRKAALLSVLMLVRSTVVFPLCHRFFKAIGVANDALFANWCMLEYVTYCNLGLRFYVPPLYFMVSLIKA